MINFQLLGHYGLHLYHCMEQVLKEFKFLAFAIKCHGGGCNWSNCHRVWFDLEIDQHISQSIYRVLGCCGTSGSGAGRVVSKETLWLDSCLSSFGCEWIRPDRISGICRWVSVAPVTM